MAEVIQFPRPHRASREARIATIGRGLATLRAASGGDGRLDDHLATLISDTIDGVWSALRPNLELTTLGEVDEPARARVLAEIEAELARAVREMTVQAVTAVQLGMVHLAVEASGGRPPPR